MTLPSFQYSFVYCDVYRETPRTRRGSRPCSITIHGLYKYRRAERRPSRNYIALSRFCAPFTKQEYRPSADPLTAACFTLMKTDGY
ncbi:hypothetical protein EVAR_38813_1 [Eumeta japonica]|uniref:Uncharacterized protein n=1 Tax=Eumeta variegata TaxID=151549 RepID=A0A4C1XTD7_EUMVA|nr:hypothetical protein EVAR_38813_1 [Eumeta japonica]